ncbi:MAG TPA: precorrin-3B C(17)-methyltransferase [Acidimicrobiales bacterium]|nr:precorrin-3B C(17)-methyltransferase [Acidimicrobiales bacterium]
MSRDQSPRGGRLAIVGLGPGGPGWRTAEASALLAGASDLVGYGTYLDMVEDQPAGQVRHRSDNREEGERAAAALDLAAQGRAVALVSSGDPGVFAMAAAVMEQLDRPDRPAAWEAVEVVVSPGVSAAQAAAARVGAPLGHDFAVISLSDNLKPWAVVESRLAAAAGADFVLALYNPVSRHRPWQLGHALAVIGHHRSPGTPVVVARDVGRPAEQVAVVALGDLAPEAVDMRTILVVGSSTTTRVRVPGFKEPGVYTPRRYPGGPSGLRE